MKKAYAKVKAQEHNTWGPVKSQSDSEPTLPSSGAVPSSLELHPDRQAMLDATEADNGDADPDGHGAKQYSRATDHSKQRRPRPKPSRYAKEMVAARERKAEIERRRQAREAREKDRRDMSKAKRPSKDGKVKLGRQGTVLLSRVRRLTAEGKI